MNRETLEKIKSEVEFESKELLGDKLTRVILYGSFAREDFDEESDIDFALMSEVSEKDIPSYNNKLGEVTSKISIKYGILVSLIIISSKTFNEYKNDLPFYMNLVKEGKIIYG